jgi:vacuolar-type H+-ATPase subunit E/Vma4
MAKMEKIGEAILGKVKAEAEGIIKEAEGRADQEIEQAEKQHLARLEGKKARMIQEAREEAARIEAQASVKARLELSRAKADVIDEIISKVKEKLSATSGDKSLLVSLVKEAVDALGSNKVRVYVLPKDVKTVKKLLNEDRELAGKIAEVKEYDGAGGVIVEDIEGKVRIDNTYDTRLEMLLPQLLPEIGRELF